MPLNALLNTHYVPKTKTLLALMHARAHPHNTVHFPRWLHAKIIIPTHAGTNTCKRAHTHIQRISPFSVTLWRLWKWLQIHLSKNSWRLLLKDDKLAFLSISHTDTVKTMKIWAIRPEFTQEQPQTKRRLHAAGASKTQHTLKTSSASSRLRRRHSQQEASVGSWLCRRR